MGRLRPLHPRACIKVLSPVLIAASGRSREVPGRPSGDRGARPSTMRSTGGFGREEEGEV
jgi:hypothetical protein